jgi:hypothetical protein
MIIILNLAGLHMVKLQLSRVTRAADVMQNASTQNLHAYAQSGENALLHSSVYGRLSPKHALSGTLRTLAEDKRPDANWLID